MKVFLVDDHQLFREGLRGMLEVDDRVEVVGESDNALDALKSLETISPDVMLVDLNLPDHDGVWLVGKIRARWGKLPVLMLSMHDGGQEVLEALSQGANGYLTKTVDREELMAALVTVANGGTHLCSSVAAPVLERLKQFKPTSVPPLTERESEILQLVVAGKNNSEIAQTLSLSVSRIKFHLSALFQKFDVSDRTSLAVEASSRGALTSEG
ncbi:MAG: response regulator transcription factor [Vulcanimicrobiota bacterium]